jgi:hypothetical protein
MENSLVMVKNKTLKQGIKVSTDLDGIPESIRFYAAFRGYSEYKKKV